jgi:hypothetical protein
MTFQATSYSHTEAEHTPEQGHEGALAAFGRSVRAAFAGSVENHLVATLDPALQLSADGAIAGVGVLLSVANTSNHTLDYELTAMRLVVEGHEGQISAPLGLHGELAPERAASVAECLSIVPRLTAGRMVEGSLEITLNYGVRGGSHRHSLTACYALAFKAGDQDIAAFTYHPI